MRIGLFGFPLTGKSTLFHPLTGGHASPGGSDGVQLGVARVPDPRLDRLAEMHHPRKVTPATVDYVDVPGTAKGEGAALLADGIITPPISITSAVEGLSKLPALHGITTDTIVVIVLSIMVAFFFTQQFGTHSIGRMFGPVMTVWFLMLALLGGVRPISGTLDIQT